MCAKPPEQFSAIFVMRSTKCLVKESGHENREESFEEKKNSCFSNSFYTNGSLLEKNEQNKKNSSLPLKKQKNIKDKPQGAEGNLLICSWCWVKEKKSVTIRSSYSLWENLLSSTHDLCPFLSYCNFTNITVKRQT